MGHPRSTSALVAVAATAAVALVQLELAVAGADLATYSRVLLLVCGAASAAAARQLHLVDRFETRLCVLGSSLVTVTGATLSASVGLPGSAATGATTWSVVAVVLGCVVVAVVSLGSRSTAAPADYLSSHDD